VFTGIISGIGEVKSIARKGLSTRLEITCAETVETPGLGDSVAVNGVCLSVTGKNNNLVFDVVRNTLNMTNLKRLKPGSAVNMEGALRLGDALSGHMVSGHIDAERAIKSNRKTSRGWALDIGICPGDERYLVARGSIALDGVSLTVGELSRGFFRVFLIPHTLGNTTLRSKKTGDYVNVEFDMTAKYAARAKQTGSVTEEMLREKGFV